MVDPIQVYRIQMFGTTTVHAAGRVLGSCDLGGRKPRQVLQLLARHAGHPMPKDRLADLLWGDEPPRDADGAVEHYVAVLRRQLFGRRGPDRPALRTDPGGYVLDPTRVEVDLHSFLRVARDPAAWLDTCGVAAAIEASREELFEDEPYAPWADEARAEVARLRTDLLVRAAELALLDGDAGTAVRHATEAAAAEPHLESAHRTLVAAHYLQGDQARALGAFARCAATLRDDLGVEPAEPTRTMQLLVLRQASWGEVVAGLVPLGLRSA